MEQITIDFKNAFDCSKKEKSKQYIFKLLPLQGVLLTASVPSVLPWIGAFGLSVRFNPTVRALSFIVFF